MTFPVVYDRCNAPGTGPKPGAVALMDWALATYPAARNLGIYNPRRIRGGSAWSVHACGRALDVGFPVRKPGGHPEGNELAAHMVEHHETLGIQQVIWAGRVWSTRSLVWRGYTGTSDHFDHVHAELTVEAGNQLTRRIIEGTHSAQVKDVAMLDIIKAYIAGGREPAPWEVHAWAVDIARKELRGEPVTPTLQYITWSVQQEPKETQ